MKEEAPILLGFDNTTSIGAFLDDLYAKDEAEQAKLQEKIRKKKPKKRQRLNSGPGSSTLKLKATGRDEDSPVQEHSAECGPGESTSSPRDAPETIPALNTAFSGDPVIRCGNCSSSTTSKTWYNSCLEKGQSSKRCGACYIYEKHNRKARPFLSEDLKCTKCGVAILKKGACYSKIKCGSLLCRTCRKSGKLGHSVNAGCSPSCAQRASP
ncbi:hypothetical protein C8R45DRAFT_1018053 [Mycena sanguinolenta]|nr:hypothetical protein C8R45DRAFT_1018053 [Mycena sanguinolenta]